MDSTGLRAAIDCDRRRAETGPLESVQYGARVKPPLCTVSIGRGAAVTRTPADCASRVHSSRSTSSLEPPLSAHWSRVSIQFDSISRRVVSSRLFSSRFLSRARLLRCVVEPSAEPTAALLYSLQNVSVRFGPVALHNSCASRQPLQLEAK